MKEIFNVENSSFSNYPEFSNNAKTKKRSESLYSQTIDAMSLRRERLQIKPLFESLVGPKPNYENYIHNIQDLLNKHKEKKRSKLKELNKINNLNFSYIRKMKLLKNISLIENSAKVLTNKNIKIPETINPNYPLKYLLINKGFARIYSLLQIL